MILLNETIEIFFCALNGKLHVAKYGKYMIESLCCLIMYNQIS